MNVPLIGLFGCIGAAAPEIVRLYKMRFAPPHIERPIHYILVSIAFFILGGIVAIILPTTTLWGAFYVGVSLPIIISGIGTRSLSFFEYESEPQEKVSFIEESGIEQQRRKMKLREYLGILFT